jgi:hypothetical protein
VTDLTDGIFTSIDYSILQTGIRHSHAKHLGETQMKNNTPSPKSSSHKRFFVGKALLAAAIMMGFSSGASAFSDVPAFSQRILTIAKQIQEYKTQLDQYKADADKYAALVTKIQGLGSQLTLLTTGMNTPLKEREATFGMKEKCPSPGGGIPTLGSLLSSIKLNKNASLDKIKEDQQEICLQIVNVQNLRYNESIKVINKMRERAKTLKDNVDASRAAAVGEDESKIGIANFDLDRLIADSEIDLTYSNALIQSYDGYITSLKENQAMLLEVAMKGNQGDDGLVAAISRKLVQGAVLKASLSALATKDR